MYNFTYQFLGGIEMYFDVRVQTPMRNIIFIKANEEFVTIDGHIVLGLSSPLRVNKISLNFNGILNVHFKETFQTKEGMTLGTIPFETDECVVSCDWKNLLTNPNGKINDGDVYNKMQKSKSFTPSSESNGRQSEQPKLSQDTRAILPFSHLIPMGETPFPDTSNHDNVTFELPPGNYCLPFTIKIPSYLPETIESLGTASIVYRFKSVIDVVNNNNLIKNKYVRVIRMPPPLEATQEHLIENSWIGKMQYKIRLPRKNVAIGSNLKIFVLIIPLLKDLKLDMVKLQIIQTVKLKTKTSNEIGERRFTKDSDIYLKSFPMVNSNDLPSDSWPLILDVPLPFYLSQCSPDVETFNDCISIKHRMILYINFSNSNGHISQIKSKLPIKFTISPDEYIVGKSVEFINEDKVKFSRGYQLIFENGADEPFKVSNSIKIPNCINNNPDEFLFDDVRSESCDEPTFNSKMAIPPPYTESQYDSLFEPHSNTFVPSPRSNTPVNGGSRTPSQTNLMSIWKTPKYIEVYDDDNVGEPTPIYSPSSTNLFGQNTL